MGVLVFCGSCAGRISVIHEVDSRYVLKRFFRNPDCSGRKNSEWSSGLVHLLSSILLTGGGRGCGVFGGHSNWQFQLWVPQC